MTRARHLLAGATTISVLLIAPGCDAGTGGPSESDTLAAPSPPPTSTSTAAIESITSSATGPQGKFPIPPGAVGWPTKDVETCKQIGEVNEPELFVRVPVATPDCLIFSNENDVLVVAAREIEFNIGAEEKVELPGFDGEVRSILGPISQGVAYVAQPTGEAVKYVVLWDGGTSGSIEQIITDLFVEQ
jgi:hypothetical protein